MTEAELLIRVAAIAAGVAILAYLAPRAFRAILIMIEDRRMPSFEALAMNHFENNLGAGCYQRIDGVECFSRLGEYSFLSFRLDRLTEKSPIRRREFGSIWRSCRHMPSYGIPGDKARNEGVSA